MVETTEAQKDHIYIFCYGSNGPRQLCERIGAEYKDLMTRTLPAIAKGWLRGFKSLAVTWGGCSTATIWETGKQEDTVCGTIVKMTPEEVASLDPYEAYPWKYYRKVIKVTAYKAGPTAESPLEAVEVDCQPYIIVED